MAFHNIMVEFLESAGLEHDLETKGRDMFVTILMPPSCKGIDIFKASEQEWEEVKEATSMPSYAQYVDRKRSGLPDLPSEAWQEMDDAFKALKESGVGQLEDVDVDMSEDQKESWVEKLAQESKDPNNIEVPTR